MFRSKKLKILSGILIGATIAAIICIATLITCYALSKNLKYIYLDSLGYSYATTNYGEIIANEDQNGDALSLYIDGEEAEFSHGYFAHAYSTIVFDELETCGYQTFQTYIGINKTARVENSSTSVIFRIYIDNEEVFTSDTFDAYTEAQLVTLDITGANRITLIADSVDGNANDHAVWADCSLSYYMRVKPTIIADDIEFPSAYQVTADNILSMVKATDCDGNDISDKITYSTNYKQGQTGTFTVTFKVSDGKVSATKTVNMEVQSTERYISDADSDYLATPFANYVYYGRTLLSTQARLAYDFCMAELLKVDISDSSKTTLTLNLQDNGIYIFPTEVKTIKTYLMYDESRLYFIYYWSAGYDAGVSYTTKNGLVDTVTFSLYNGSGQYYYGQNNQEVYSQAASIVSSILSNVQSDMSDAQMIKATYNAYTGTLSYSNTEYADGFYGAFITHYCICSGYSQGYKYIAQRMGIQVAYIIGMGGTHAWLNVRIDGEWYITDTTWLDFSLYGLAGADLERSVNNMYSVMPQLAEHMYDLDLTNYPLFSIKDSYLYVAGENFDLNDLVDISSGIAEKAPIVSLTYAGTLDLGKTGNYTIEVTAVNSLGNTITKEVTIMVAQNAEALSQYQGNGSGSGNTKTGELYLYTGSEEQLFEDGIYIKSTSSYSVTYDISSQSYSYFSAYFSIDSSIRANTPYGAYANATINIYADGELIYSSSKIGWKSAMVYVALQLPENTTSLTLEVVDSSGQGAVAFGDCTLYY